MNKKLCLIAALCLLTLFGCGKSKTSKENEAAPKEVKTIEDEASLTALWNDYITDCSFTVANGNAVWNDPKDSGAENICNYLFLKMQKNEDYTDMSPIEDYEKSNEFWIKASKLNEYYKKYFEGEYDFKGLKSYSCYYDSEKDAVVFNPLMLENIPQVGYNQPEEFPNNTLESITLYDDNSVIAKVASQYWLTDTEGNQLKYYRYIRLQKREDNSYYFLSCKTELPLIAGGEIDGDFKPLPLIEGISSYINLGFSKDGKIILSNSDSRNINFALADINKGIIENEVSFPLKSKDSTYNIVRKDDTVAVIEREADNFSGELISMGLYTVNLESKKRRYMDLPADCFYIHDISKDFSEIIYQKDIYSNFLIYNFKNKTTIEIQKTSPVLPENKDDPSAMMSAKTFGSAQFVNNDKQVFLTQYGYESTEGYMLYNKETKQDKFFPLASSWSGAVIVTDNGVYVGNIMDDDNSLYHTFIKFDTQEQVDVPKLNYYDFVGNYYIHPGRYIPLLIPTEEEDYEKSMVECKIAVFDSENLTLKESGVTIKIPTSSNFTSFIGDNDGNIYLANSSINKDNACFIKNK